jgi:hypothetical protein
MASRRVCCSASWILCKTLVSSSPAHASLARASSPSWMRCDSSSACSTARSTCRSTSSWENFWLRDFFLWPEAFDQVRTPPSVACSVARNSRSFRFRGTRPPWVESTCLSRSSCVLNSMLHAKQANIPSLLYFCTFCVLRKEKNRKVLVSLRKRSTYKKY